jgi:hypothetical protein
MIVWSIEGAIQQTMTERKLCLRQLLSYEYRMTIIVGGKINAMQNSFGSHMHVCQD